LGRVSTTCGSGWVHAQQAIAIERVYDVPTPLPQVVLTRPKHEA